MQMEDHDKDVERKNRLRMIDREHVGTKTNNLRLGTSRGVKEHGRCMIERDAQSVKSPSHGSRRAGDEVSPVKIEDLA